MLPSFVQDRAGALEGRNIAVRRPRGNLLQRLLLRLSTRPFGADAALQRQQPALWRNLEDLRSSGWTLLQARPRSYIQWRAGNMMQASDANVLVLPDDSFPLTDMERSVVIALDVTRRVSYARTIARGDYPRPSDDPWTDGDLRRQALRRLQGAEAWAGDDAVAELQDRLYLATAL